MAQLKALLLDVDGTLADTERDGHRIAFNRAFRDFGLQWNWDESLYKALLAVTGGKERIRYYIEDWKADWPKNQTISEFAAHLHRSKTEHYLNLLRQGQIPLRPGVERLLREAVAENITLAIATTTTPENVHILLENTLGKESGKWFSVIAAGDMVTHKKPAPDVFILAMQMLNLPPENCLAFEDSENGLRSSVAAGVKTVVTLNDYTRAGDYQAADLVVDGLGESHLSMSVLQGTFPGSIIDITGLREWFSGSL